MQTITPKNKQKISYGPGPSEANMMPRRGPGPAAQRKSGIKPDMAVEDRSSSAKKRR